MRKLGKLLTILAVVPILATAGLYAVDDQQRGLYGNLLPNLNDATRQSPAGFTEEPGSELVYFIDTGLNLDRGPNAITSSTERAKSVFDATGINGKGDSIWTNFITVTNTHPTQAVTVHVRYFNDKCEDLLDFLVILTCNDTLIFNPFDFEIPGSNFGGVPINTGSRIFGSPNLGASFPPISVAQFASGRFFITITASGTSTNDDDEAELLFPRELVTELINEKDRGGVAQNLDCANLTSLSSPGVGSVNGVSSSNLHVFNAAAIAFNFLVGSWTTAVPRKAGTISSIDEFFAWHLNAWARPAVRFRDETDMRNEDGEQIGDGEQAGFGPSGLPRILMGGEPVLQSDRVTPIGAANLFYLRNEAHNGDTRLAVVSGVTFRKSHWGAIAWDTIFDTRGGAGNEDQWMNWLSFVDDYDGSNNTVFVSDKAKNAGSAETLYTIQIYDADEDLFLLPPESQINISPIPPTGPDTFLSLIVDCLGVWVSKRDVGLQVDNLSVGDLGIISAEILTGGGGNSRFDGLNAAVNPLKNGSNGWVRFVRNNNKLDGRNLKGQGGTTSLDSAETTTAEASFFTQAAIVITFDSFAGARRAPTVAADPAVSADPDGNPAP